MTTRGTTIRTQTPDKLTLLRPMITRRYELVVDHKKCCSCKICELVCPHDAISLSKVELTNGRVAVRPVVDIDPKKCSFCGECVVMCPTHAISMTVNGKAEIPVIKGEAFPLLIRKNVVDAEAARASKDTSYVDRCPVGAIVADVRRDADGNVVAVESVDVDREKCIACTRCMEEGPKGAFTVTKPYKGRAFINVLLCPPGCQACADICPTKCITYDGEKVNLDKRFCLFCSACEVVCPVEGAVRITRAGFEHTYVESGAWTTALRELVSIAEASREFDVKGQDKRRNLVLSGMLLQEVPKKYK